MGGGSARAGSEPRPPPRRHRTAAHLLPSHLGVAAPSLIQNVVLLSAPQVELLKQTGASGTETRSAGPCPWAARSGAGSWSVGHQHLRLRGGRAQGRASTSPEATVQGGPAPEGEAGLPRACGPHSAPTRQMQLLLPIRKVEPRAQEAQSGCGPDVRAPCAPRRTPAPPAPPQPRPTYVIDDLVRALQVRGGVRDAAELEERGQRSVSARAPFTGPFPERRCRPPGTRQPGLAAGRPGPFLRGTRCWLRKGPTPVWTCGAGRCSHVSPCGAGLVSRGPAQGTQSPLFLQLRPPHPEKPPGLRGQSVGHPRGRPLG